MEKTIVLIDDTQDQKEILTNLVEHLRKKEGINALGEFINPNSKDYWNSSKDPDLDKIINGIREKLTDRRPDLIVVDQYYSDISFTGIDVIEKLRSISKFKNCKIFLYSGNRDKIVREIFENDSLSTGDRVKKLAQIISYKIERFLDKDFKSEAINILKKVDIKDILPTKLRAIENGKINLFSSKYNQLTMAELADMIESNNPETSQILDEIFELTLSHYVKIDEGLQ
jgi:hypothetical protein